MVGALRIRGATAAQRADLEALQRRSSDVWEQYREQLAANPDAIALPQVFIGNGWVRVAVAVDDQPIGFSVVIPTNDAVYELDGLRRTASHASRRWTRAGRGRGGARHAVRRGVPRGDRRPPPKASTSESASRSSAAPGRASVPRCACAVISRADTVRTVRAGPRTGTPAGEPPCSMRARSPTRTGVTSLNLTTRTYTAHRPLVGFGAIP
jgi:hypothetical protein